MSKIGLGTVQFGVTYGLNSKSAPSDETIRAILNAAQTKGINVLDTSFGYGDAENVIGRTGLAPHFNIVSKYSTRSESALSSFEISINRLNVKALYGYLVHYFDLYRENKSIWNDFLRLREEKRVSKIGFSIYDAEELEVLLHDNVDFDIIQIPYSILDTEFSPYLKVLKDRGVEVHVRSVFLQGLIFKEAADLPPALSSLADYLKTIKIIAEEKQISIGELALNYVINNPYIDKVILGVHSLEQFERNLRSVRAFSFDDVYIPIREKDKNLLKPKNWKL